MPKLAQAGRAARPTINREPAVRSFPINPAAAILLQLEKYRQWQTANGRCAYCGREFGTVVEIQGRRIVLRLHWDHFLPVSAGGETQGNLRPACHLCNLWKTDHQFPSEASLIGFLEEQWENHLNLPADANTVDESSNAAPIEGDGRNDSVPNPALSLHGQYERPNRTLFRAPRVIKLDAPAAPKVNYWATCKEPPITLDTLEPGERFEFYAFPGEIVTLVAKTASRAITTPHHGETNCSLKSQVVKRAVQVAAA